MRYDAWKERRMPMQIKGIKGYFNDMRIGRGTVPDGLHFWELADGESDGMPCRYKPGILVNFYGTFITTSDLPVDESRFQEGFINTDEKWGFTGSRYHKLEDMVRIESGNLIPESAQPGSAMS